MPKLFTAPFLLTENVVALTEWRVIEWKIQASANNKTFFETFPCDIGHEFWLWRTLNLSLHIIIIKWLFEVSTSWRVRECTDFYKRHLKSNLMAWRWNWYVLLSSVGCGALLKVVHLPQFAKSLNISVVLCFCVILEDGKKCSTFKNLFEN